MLRKISTRNCIALLLVTTPIGCSSSQESTVQSNTATQRPEVVKTEVVSGLTLKLPELYNGLTVRRVCLLKQTVDHASPPREPVYQLIQFTHEAPVKYSTEEGLPLNCTGHDNHDANIHTVARMQARGWTNWQSLHLVEGPAAHVGNLDFSAESFSLGCGPRQPCNLDLNTDSLLVVTTKASK